MQNAMRKSWTRGSLATFLTASLKGISQVLLIENAISGLLILLAITTSSYLLGIMTLLSAFIGNIVGNIGWGR